MASPAPPASPVPMQRPERQVEDLRPALVFLSGELIAVPIPLEREEVILGRALEADVRVNDTKVSRRHAKINRVPAAAKKRQLCKDQRILLLTVLGSGLVPEIFRSASSRPSKTFRARNGSPAVTR